MYSKFDTDKAIGRAFFIIIDVPSYIPHMHNKPEIPFCFALFMCVEKSRPEKRMRMVFWCPLHAHIWLESYIVYIIYYTGLDMVCFGYSSGCRPRSKLKVIARDVRLHNNRGQYLYVQESDCAVSTKMNAFLFRLLLLPSPLLWWLMLCCMEDALCTL